MPAVRSGHVFLWVWFCYADLILKLIELAYVRLAGSVSIRVPETPTVDLTPSRLQGGK